MSKRTFLPISIDITDKRILVIGGNADGLKKTEILLRTTQNIDVLDTEFLDAFASLPVNCIYGEYNMGMLQDYILVYSCMANPTFDRQLVADGEHTGTLINIHDVPELCRFVSPAIYRHDPFTVAVGSNAEKVSQAIALRNFIEQVAERNFFGKNE